MARRAAVHARRRSACEGPGPRIAYVFQGANLLPHFTAFENVAFADRLAAGQGSQDAGRGPRELLELVGLAAKADNLPAGALRRRGPAGGDRARARAAARSLLLCDEPTGHLDSDTGERVLDLIDALQRELGFALVIATHDADVAGRFERAVELEDGRVVAAAAMTTYARLAFAGSFRAPCAPDPHSRPRAGRRGRVARRDAALHRPLAADDDRERRRAACRSTGRGRSRPVGAAQVVASEVSKQPGILQASPTATAPFASAEHKAPLGQIRAGAGAILAVPPDYLRHIKTFRFLQGSLKPGDVVLDQQLAATLQAQIGDKSALTPRTGAKPPSCSSVSGVALVTAPDVLFQPLNPLLGPAPAQPPGERRDHAARHLRADDRAAPRHDRDRVARQLGGSGRADRRPVAGAGPGRSGNAHRDPEPRVRARDADQQPGRALAARPGAVRRQPLRQPQHRRRRRAVRETLYIMLAVPGALIALGLAYLAALGTVERDRRELALLRARGARRRDLLALAAIESPTIGLLAGGCSARRGVPAPSPADPRRRRA